ncbi:MAG: hypothetical protein COW73_07750 [Nitrospirae bacterium CG18_big_fil_WC_8_21_14_2_50_70_55]|nr:phosphatase PAP2 family protein [Deltaproteobacteria bacterium]PIQ04495.1 MAG: hypothetical protein COW73_07750 [Nitrospirae bacterium CG18_big_fil_WC_8_21_14_2_50_70_55]PIU79131.1 MAG: hypothetical protein COS73_05080 [Nitrospirae bacterium CG06_land_8_20_14_3_00_70_43]
MVSEPVIGSPPHRRRALALALLLAALALLAWALTTAPAQRFDHALFLAVQHHLRTPSLDRVTVHVTMLGDAAVVLLLLLWAAMVVRRPFLTEALLSLVATAAAVGWLKHLVCRLRPSQVITGLHLLGPHLGNLSFPSGHTTTAVAIAGVVGHRFPRLRPLLYLTAAAVGVSRVYNAVHFPGDVLAAALLGAAIALATLAAAPRINRLTGHLHLHHTDPAGRALHTLLLALMGTLLVWQAFKTKQVPDSWRWPLLLIGLITCATALGRTRRQLHRQP